MPDWTFPVLFPDARVSSGIGARSSPGGVGSTNHKGIDIAAPRGTPVVAPTDLTVTRSYLSDSYGNVIYANDTLGNEYRFAHLANRGADVGDMIGAGGYLGGVGATGHATGNHLHFEIRDSSGNLLTDAMHAVVEGGKKLGSPSSDNECGWNPICHAGRAVGQLTESIIGEVLPGGKIKLDNSVGGLFGECGPLDLICKLEKWLAKTGFVQRSALFLVAMILIIGGILFLAKGYNPIEQAKKVIA